MDPNTDYDRFESLMKGFFANWRQEASPALIAIYWEGLKEAPYDRVKNAILACMADTEFMPPLAVVRKRINGSSDGQVALAWTALNDAIDRYGARKSIDFEDKALNATVRAMGGWETVCGMPQSEWDRFAWSKFKGFYERLMGQTIGDEAGAPLVGTHERKNRFLGFDDNDKRLAAYTGQTIRIGAKYPLAITNKTGAPVKVIEADLVKRLSVSEANT